MDYDLIVVKTLERVYKNYYYIIRGCYDEKTKAYEADHSDPADRDIACHHRIYYLFCSERKPVILDVTVFDVFLSDLFMGNVIFV